MLLLAAAAWVGGLAARLVPPGALVATAALSVVPSVAVLALAGARGRSGRRVVLTALAALLVAGAVACSGLVRQAQVSDNPVAGLARQRAQVHVELTVTSDARVVTGRFGRQVMVAAEVRRVEGRGSAWVLRAPVLVIGAESWQDVRLGETLRAAGRLSPSGKPDLAAVLGVDGAPERLAGPDAWWAGADAVRRSLRESVADRPADQRALVPALVDG